MLGGKEQTQICPGRKQDPPPESAPGRGSAGRRWEAQQRHALGRSMRSQPQPLKAEAKTGRAAQGCCARPWPRAPCPSEAGLPIPRSSHSSPPLHLVSSSRQAGPHRQGSDSVPVVSLDGGRRESLGRHPLLTNGDALGKPPSYLNLFLQLQRKTDLPTHLPRRVVRTPHALAHTLGQLTCTENYKPHAVQRSGNTLVKKEGRLPILRELIPVRD